MYTIFFSAVLMVLILTMVTLTMKHKERERKRGGGGGEITHCVCHVPEGKSEENASKEQHKQLLFRVYLCRERRREKIPNTLESCN